MNTSLIYIHARKAGGWIWWLHAVTISSGRSCLGRAPALVSSFRSMGRKIALHSLFYLPSSLALFVKALWCKQRSLFSSRFRKGTRASCRAVDNVDIIHFSHSVLHYSLSPSLPLQFARWFNFISYTHSPDHISPFQANPAPRLSKGGVGEGSGKDHTFVLGDEKWKQVQTNSAKVAWHLTFAWNLISEACVLVEEFILDSKRINCRKIDLIYQIYGVIQDLL